MSKQTTLASILLILVSIGICIYYIGYKKSLNQPNSSQHIYTNQPNSLDKYKVADGVYYISDNLDEYNELDKCKCNADEYCVCDFCEYCFDKDTFCEYCVCDCEYCQYCIEKKEIIAYYKNKKVISQ